eukprot:1103275-Rhodomonas_salina.4
MSGWRYLGAFEVERHEVDLHGIAQRMSVNLTANIEADIAFVSDRTPHMSVDLASRTAIS